MRLGIRVLQFPADPHAAAYVAKGLAVVPRLAGLSEQSACFFAAPVGPLKHGADLLPRSARGRPPETQAPMAVFLDLRGWARDAMADGLIQTAPLAQPPVARNASQQHRGRWRLLASARQLIRFQAATLA